MAQRNPSAFGTKTPRPAKRNAGRTKLAAETPLNLRTTGVTTHEGLGEYVRTKVGRRLGKFASFIERITVRFEDTNGPRGGVDIVSRIKVVLSHMPSVLVESRGKDPRHAFDLASHDVERTVRRQLGRAGASEGRARNRRALPRSSRTDYVAPNPPPAGGALIGRRVGRSEANLARVMERPGKVRRDELVDTSSPRVSATDRKAGGGSTARRNAKVRTRRATATLEDSATGRPTRKSTRKSANRQKSGTLLEQAATRATRSPKRRAGKAAARDSVTRKAIARKTRETRGAARA